jgi:hypothetical protein
VLHFLSDVVGHRSVASCHCPAVRLMTVRGGVPSCSVGRK